ncbi:MAG: GNAT family N-acetyltransferase [Actinomycetes bacterium]
MEERSRFEVREDGEVAVLTYEVEDEGREPAVTFLHTAVPDSLAGRGVGSRLAETGVRWAQEGGLAVVVECSFVRGWLERHPEKRTA